MSIIDDIEYRIKEFFKSYGNEEKWIVGLSGGADSTALLTAMINCRINSIPIHCNFNLRGEESMRDENFSSGICKNLGLDLIIKKFNTREYCKKNGVSLETGCRELRYTYFRELMNETGAKGIVVAHNQNDNIETFLLNLFRGTGISGLRGMLPIANDIYRPFLQTTRFEIEEYLKNLKIDFITDSSNLENDYTRNKIRNLILPFINKEFPDIYKTIELTRKNLAETEEYIQDRILSDKKEYYSEKCEEIDIERLIKNETNARFILYNLLSNSGMNSTQIENILQSASAGTSGKFFKGKKRSWILNHGKLKRLFQNEQNEKSLIDEFIISIVDRNRYQPDFSNRTVFFDGDLINIEKFYARNWQNGDVMQPFGMRGKRKLSDIFSDNKISIDVKHSLPILTYEDEIVWIPGIKRSKHFPVTNTTEKIVKVEFKGFLRQSS